MFVAAVMLAGKLLLAVLGAGVVGGVPTTCSGVLCAGELAAAGATGAAVTGRAAGIAAIVIEEGKDAIVSAAGKDAMVSAAGSDAIVGVMGVDVTTGVIDTDVTTGVTRMGVTTGVTDTGVTIGLTVTDVPIGVTGTVDSDDTIGRDGADGVDDTDEGSIVFIVDGGDGLPISSSPFFGRPRFFLPCPSLFSSSSSSPFMTLPLPKPPLTPRLFILSSSDASYSLLSVGTRSPFITLPLHFFAGSSSSVSSDIRAS